MGFDNKLKATIKAEIDRYNKFCENGEDEDFGKDSKLLLPINQGPFFGVFCMPEHPMTGTVTLSGLMVNEDQAVIDKNYNPIVNLYAVGNSSGGKFSSYYVTPMQGLTLGIAMTLGRVLGKELAGA
jgi:predicted oxidoreductase